MADTLGEFLQRVELKKDRAAATVLGVKRDPTSGQQTSATVQVSGSAMTIPLDLLSPPLAVGDGIGLANMGSVSLADWRLTSVTGSRPSAGYTQFFDTTEIGGLTFEPGDFILGQNNSAGPHWFFDYSDGTFYKRAGGRIMGYETAAGKSVWGPPDGMHWQVDPATNVLAVFNAGQELYAFDGDTGYIRGWQGLGKPGGPGIRWGVVQQVDEDGNPVYDAAGRWVERYVWRLIGGNGVPIVSATTGTQEEPDDASWLIGNELSEDSLAWADGALNLRGEIHARSGSIDGFLTIGQAGGIYQGTGSAAAPTTGLKIWNEDGVGRLAGYTAGVLQAGFDSAGRFTWAGGVGILDASGMMLYNATGAANTAAAVQWSDGAGGYVSSSAAWYDGSGTHLLTGAYGSIAGGRRAYNTLAATSLPTGITENIAEVRLTATAPERFTVDFFLRAELAAQYAQLAGATYLDVSGARVASVADATAATDALNRQTGDSRYAYRATLTDRNEPTGFVDPTKSTLAFNVSAPDRTFTIAPTGSTFDVYCASVKYAKGSTTKQIANTNGLHYIYFDTAGTIQESTTPWDISSGNCPIATVYWNGTAYVMGDERHGIQMDGQTHEYLHETHGAVFASGGALTAAADGSTFVVAAGEWYDDDLEHTPAQQTTASIFYRASGAWVWTAAQAPYFHSVGSVPQYDNAGTIGPVGANRYSMTWVYWTNSAAHPVAFLMGQGEYTTQAAAEAIDPSSIVTGDFVSAEWRLLYKIVWQRNGATITYKSTTDYRRQLGSAGSFVATDHGSLSGLSDDDHIQYLRVDGTRASTGAQTFSAGIVGPSWKPASDSTTAIQLQNAAGSPLVTVDTSNGRLGVGLTPTEKLDLAGNARLYVANPVVKIYNSDVSNQYGLEVGYGMGSGANHAYINNSYPAASSQLHLQIRGTNYLSILDSGNVGIGTAAPSVPLEIRRANDGGTILYIGTASSYGFAFARSNTTGALSIQGDQTGFDNILLAPTSGNVGIGTTAPAARLHAYHANNIAPSLIFDADAAAILQNADAQLAFGMSNASPYALWLQARQSTNVSWPLVLNPLGGKVGIGTAAPSYKLHVSGNLYATSIAGIGTTPDLAIQLNVAKIGSASASSQTGAYAYAYATANGSYPIYGSRGLGYAAGDGAQTGGVLGGDFLAINNGAGAVSYLGGLTATAYNAGAGNVAQVTVLNVSATQCYSTGTIGSAYGIFIGTQKNTGVTTGYGIYQQGADDLNYFAGGIQMAKLGIGVTPVAPSTGWAMSNVTTDKVLDANATTIDELADVLGTLIDYLKTTGLLGA